MIERFVSGKLKSLLGYFPVTAIVGPRQVGKTTLARLIVKSIKKESIYIDLENDKDRAKLEDPILFFENNMHKCVILDEIQRMPELFPTLRSMIDQKREAGRFVVLGSASPDLIRDSSESLAGRIAYIELSPFNISELPKRKEKQQIHWLRGGFPDAYLAPSDELCSDWQMNFIKTYVERDLPALGLNVDRNILRKLWQMIAHSHGSILNMANLGKSLELSINTIKRYLSLMEAAFLIRQLQPYSTNMKKRLVKSPKIFVRDSGILNHLLNINSWEEMEGHPMLGNSWEGYVIEQIIQKLPKNTEAYFYRTHDGSEMDLVLVQANKVVNSIEIKYASIPQLTKGNLLAFEDLKAKNNFVITPNSDDYLISKNIRVCSLQTFIGEYL